MKVWSGATFHIELSRAFSGWIVRRRGADASEGEDVAGLSDDPALLDWLADQLALPPPRAALSVARAELADARNEIDQLKERLRELPSRFAHNPELGLLGVFGPTPEPFVAGSTLDVADLPIVMRAETWGKIRHALKPFATLAIALRDYPGTHLVEFMVDPETDKKFITVYARHLRALLRATGLFTDEMLAHSHPPLGPAAKPEADAGSPPPADRSPDAAPKPGDDRIN